MDDASAAPLDRSDGLRLPSGERHDADGSVRDAG
jgi:hypothetical protein